MRHVLVLAAVLTGAVGTVGAEPSQKNSICVHSAAQLWLGSEAFKTDVSFEEMEYQLGHALIFGTFVEDDEFSIPHNPVRGAGCIQDAAEGGHPQAQALLGALYHDGTGVLQDLVLAYKWLSLGALYGVDHAAQLRDQIAEQLTAAEVAESRRLAQEWLEREQ